jgi:hypothetical protein
MECPMCNNVFSKVEEILMVVDRSFYCHHCWSRFISYPDGEGGYRVEEDITGDKWRMIKRQLSNSKEFLERIT